MSNLTNEWALLAQTMEDAVAEGTLQEFGTTKYKELSDGDYLGKIHDCELGKSKAGNDQIVFKLLVTEGDDTGHVHHAYWGLKEGKSSLITLQNVKKIATEAGLLEEITFTEALQEYSLEGLIQHFLELDVTFRLKTTPSKNGGDPFRNTSIWVNQ